MTTTPQHRSQPVAAHSVSRLGGIQQRLFPPRHGRGFLKNWVHHLPIIVGLSLIVALLAHWGWFHGFQTMALDSLLLAQNSRRSDQVVIVTIGDDEFNSPELFNGLSPLIPEKLGSILKAIAAGKPRLIAVDIDTSSQAQSAGYRQLADLISGEVWPPIIWSVDGDVESGHHGGHDKPSLHVFPALAGTQSVTSGLIVMPSDPDGVIRRYYRSFQVTSEASNKHASEDSHDSSHVDSLPWAVVKEYSRQTPQAELSKSLRHLRDNRSPPNELLMNFPGDRYTFTHIAAQTVLDSYAKREFWSSEKSPIRDKIVLVGGTYRAARDVHPTPVGLVSGVELLALAVESEVQGTGIRLMHEAFAILIDILFGSLLVYLNWRFVSPRAIFLNLFAVGILALIASYITFNTFGYWLNFSLVLVGIWLHNQLDVVRELPRLHKEIHDLRSKLHGHERDIKNPSKVHSATESTPTAASKPHLGHKTPDTPSS